MKYASGKHHRRTIRLPGYDYSQTGWYFVTICTHNRDVLFGNVIEGKMLLNKPGQIVDKCWGDIPNHFPGVRLDEYVIMPNHVHGIIVIIRNDCDENEGAENVGGQNFEPLPHENKYQKIIPRSIGSIIRGFKIGVTKWFRENTDISTVWQRNYYEQIIRYENHLNLVRRYIVENPVQWQNDKYFQERA